MHHAGNEGMGEVCWFLNELGIARTTLQLYSSHTGNYIRLLLGLMHSVRKHAVVGVCSPCIGNQMRLLIGLMYRQRQRNAVVRACLFITVGVPHEEQGCCG